MFFVVVKKILYFICMCYNFVSGSYLCFREMVIVVSRWSVDDYIVILGWFLEEKKYEVFSIEFINDIWFFCIEF